MTRRRVLGVFAKEPVPGRVKTRLARESSPAFAAAAAEAFLEDTLARMTALDAAKLLLFAPDEAKSYFAGLAARTGFVGRPQGDGDLGERLSRFFEAESDAAAVAIGSDSPTLPTAFVDQAFRALEDVDVVLGPATDGGYYLIGCRRPLADLFQGIAWGTAEVLEQTVARVRGPLALLPPWYDVDTLDDWGLLRGHLAAWRRAGIDVQLPRTEALAARFPLPPSEGAGSKR